MWWYALSFMDDVDRGRLGRPLFFLDMAPMLNPDPNPDMTRDRAPAAAAIEAVTPPPDARDPECHLHRCPICMNEHAVNEARHRLAYGRQLTCSCKCEIQRRKMVKRKWRSPPRELPIVDH
jgi:hypothetical protein